MNTLVKNCRLILPDCIMENAWLRAGGGVIDDFGQGEAPGGAYGSVIDAENNYLSPGFVDTHVHGGGGCDFSDGREESIYTVLRTHLKGGTTTILPTLTSLTHEKYLACFDAFNRIYAGFPERDDIPNVEGLHIEGPYCTGAVLGAQNTATYRNVNMDEVKAYLEKAPYIKKWTAASELPGGLAFGSFLEKRGVLASIGHSNATLQEVFDAFAAGFRCITHLYSACSSYHRNGAYREGGIVEAAYLLNDMDVEMITDGVHLPPEFLRLIYKIKGAGRIAMITDATRWAGVDIPSGELKYNDLEETTSPVYIENGVALVQNRSCFAGSIALANRLVRVATKTAGIDLCSAVRMLTLTPARTVGLDKLVGSIQRGKRANLLVFNENIDIKHILLSGKAAVL